MFKAYKELKALLSHYSGSPDELELILYGLGEFFGFNDLDTELVDYLSTIMDIDNFKEYILNKVTGEC